MFIGWGLGLTHQRRAGPGGGGGAPDAHTDLLAALGIGTAALYTLTDGEVGGTWADATISGGELQVLPDYFGNAPDLVFGVGERPLVTAQSWTLDGVDDWGETAASAVFALNQAYALVWVLSYVSGGYLGSINTGGAASRFFSLGGGGVYRLEATDSFTISSEGDVTADATKRVIILRKNATTAGGIIIPDDTPPADASLSASPSGNNVLTVGRAHSGHGAWAGITVDAVLALPGLDPDPTQQGIIRDWAVAQFTAVPA
jgi:hypothetical protein